MKTMAVAWNGTTLNDKVKLLSVTELGYAHSQATSNEGNVYYEYGPHIKNTGYWLRSRNTDTAHYPSNVWEVDGTGYVGSSPYNSTGFSLAPCIRLG